MQHVESQDVIWINRTGYPRDMQPRHKGSDSLGVQMFSGDELLVLDDKKFVKEELSHDAVQILEMLDAEVQIAK